MNNRVLFLSTRLCFGLFFLMTSVYCILAYIPFTYYHFLKFTHLPWLTVFVKIHPYVYWAVLLIAAPTLRSALGRSRTKKLTIGFFIFQIAVGIVLLFHPLLVNLRNDISSFILALFSLVPLLWMATIDYRAHWNEVGWAESDCGEDSRLFRAALFSGLFVSLLYVGIFYVRYVIAGTIDVGRSEQVITLSWSVASHLLVSMALFVLLNLMRAVARLFKSPPKTEFFLCNLLAAVFMALALRNVVLIAVSFNNRLADLFALIVAVAVMAFLAGLSIRLYRPDDGEIRAGLLLAVMPLTFGRISTYAGRAVWIIAVAVLAYVLATGTAVLDWNFLAQKLSAIAVWSLTFTAFYAMSSREKVMRERTNLLLLLAVVVLFAYKTLDASRTRLPALLNEDKLDIGHTLERYAGFDVSFKVVRDILSPLRADESFYSFLNRNTNIPRTTEVKPVDVNLVERLDTKAAINARPNIFIFVIDSLRKDYLSPYNDKVTFTPSIDRFARESIVMENAFTRYGATGLSEPSIWVGGMMLHMQYISPFYRLNALQTLIEAERYESFIGMDTILSVIVKPSPSIVELDDGLANKDYEFCRSLRDLQSKLDKRQPASWPIFAYTQPQNIHVSVINREGNNVPTGGEYPGFYAPYAARIKQMDDCFGQFIAHLKARGLYDNSIVVLTADHGDSLGEEGRWGHAYTIFPEILRIPLIIHLPSNLKESLYWDAQAIAFSTDITPSLYYLLGHKPIVRSEILGRPLFTEKREEQTQYLQESYLTASSYGAVYGILSDNGRSLYIADGVNYTDYFYDLTNDPKGTRNRVTASIKAENEKLIRDHITAINRFYNFAQEQ